MNYKLIKNENWKEVEINGEKENIPHDWEIKLIKNLSTIIPGQSPENINLINDGIEFHQGNTLFSNKYIKESDKKISRNEAKKIAPKNSILISVRAPVGEINFTKKEIAIGRGLASLEPIINHDYLFYILRYYKDKIKKLGNGSTFEGMKITEFSNFPVVVSNEILQKSIASILSKQESIISHIEQLIEKNELIFKELSEQLLSGELRLKEENEKISIYKNPEDNWKEVEVNGEMKSIPKDWDYSTPKNSKFNIKTGNKDANAAIKNGAYPFFTCSANEIFKIDTYCFDTEAILISGNGSTLGEVKYYKGKFDAYQRTYVINEIKNIKFTFLYFKKYFKDSLHIIGGSIPFIKIGDIENFFIALPTDNEQILISQFLEKKEKTIIKQKELLSKEKEKFEWLLDNLLSGNYLVQELEEV